MIVYIQIIYVKKEKETTKSDSDEEIDEVEYVDRTF